MNPRAYWLALRSYLAIWAVTGVAGLGVLVLYFSLQAGLNDQQNQLMQQLVSMQQSAAQYANYQQDVAFYRSRYLRWQQQGMLQPNDSGPWVSAWPALQQQWHLPHMQYEIQPSVTCDHQNCTQFWSGSMPTGFSMMVTPIKLRWEVHHESDVLDWLQQLQQSYAGRMLVRDCRWSAVDAAESIAAECELYWFDFPNLASDQPT